MTGGIICLRVSTSEIFNGNDKLTEIEDRKRRSKSATERKQKRKGAGGRSTAGEWMCVCASSILLEFRLRMNQINYY